MAVVWTHVKGRSGGRDSKGYRTYKVIYQVQTDDRDDGPLTATDTVDLPVMYSTYSSGNDSDPYAVVVGYDVSYWTDPDENPYLWRVEVTYSSNPEHVSFGNGTIGANNGTVGTPTGPGQNSSETAPESRPWQIEFGTRQREKILGPYDNTSPYPKKVVNSAGQMFENPPTVPWSDTYLTLTGWSSTPNYDKVQYYKNSVNDDFFLGFPPNSLRVSDYKVTSQYERGAYTYQKTITLDITDYGEGWNVFEVLDAGTLQIVNGKLQQITDTSGSNITAPLDGNGVKLEGTDPDTFVYLEFAPYRYTDFDNLVA